MFKRFAWLTLAVVFTVLGLVGLLVPVLPGVLFLALAALCVSAASDRVHRRLLRHRGYSRWRRHWDASASLPVLQRCKLAFWLSADTMVRAVRGR